MWEGLTLAWWNWQNTQEQDQPCFGIGQNGKSGFVFTFTWLTQFSKELVQNIQGIG